MQDSFDAVYGCLLGHLFGDALGSTFEGLPPDYLRENFRSPTNAFHHAVARDSLRYTDDGQMMLALADFLCKRETVDHTELMRAFVEVYEPWRGYGRGARVLIEAFRDASEYEFMAEHLFPGGSLGNGGAMRSAPIGLKFVGDLERIRIEAKQSAWPTHRHELGIEGAQLIALATSLAQTESDISPDRMSKLLLPHCETVVFQNRIERLAEIQSVEDLDQFGNGIEAHESAVTAIACSALFSDDYRAAIQSAFWLGGDTDTIGAMVGSIVGARVGPSLADELPKDKLESGMEFIENVEALARRLVDSMER
ncbi:MAG: ADP-ribosylglycohydrolase family protein [Planctomycetota bacterium]